MLPVTLRDDKDIAKIMKKMIKYQDILDFWFTEISPESWFKKDLDFDAALGARFGKVVDDAENELAALDLIEVFVQAAPISTPTLPWT